MMGSKHWESEKLPCNGGAAIFKRPGHGKALRGALYLAVSGSAFLLFGTLLYISEGTEGMPINPPGIGDVSSLGSKRNFLPES